MRPDPISKAIEKAGSVKALAEALGIKPQGISQWKHIPIEHARTIETLTGIPRHELRPDVWDAPFSASAEPQAAE
ncbi:MAG TPA: Cro/CI family transcriptional regulator [Chloroflexota bacterium]|jgi:DNA-binding transcriptional regulator YdaS (Cro superfamily)